MIRRTTIELDDELLARAKMAIGTTTTRATVEEALRRAADDGVDEAGRRAAGQRCYLAQLGSRVDLEVLSSAAMWR